MTKKDIKISKGKLTETDAATVAVGETLIRNVHWNKLISKKSEKEVIKVLKSEDKRDSKAVEK